MLIEDYALIGDCETAALIGRNGSIDWLCWPNFASAACFAKLLGTEENGFWKLGPGEKVLRTSRRYEPHTLILETIHETRNGSVRVRDFMPLRGRHSRIIRVVEGLRGKVAMCGELALRFDYGQAVPWVTRTRAGLKALAGADSVWLHTTAPLEGKGFRTGSEFTVRKGQTASFVLTMASTEIIAKNRLGLRSTCRRLTRKPAISGLSGPAKAPTGGAIVRWSSAPSSH